MSYKHLIRFNMGRNFNAETAIVVAELYRYKGEWKFNPIAMGYQGGLAALCGSFGIDVSDNPTNQPAQAQAAPTIEREPQPKPVPPQPKINLSKIELKKKGEKINLEKKVNNRLGEILINLNWSRKPINQGGGGFFASIFGSGNKGIDLDLGCMIETKDGRKTVVQALDNDFGDLDFWPFVSLNPRNSFFVSRCKDVCMNEEAGKIKKANSS
nr:TerD family protein [Desulforamulus reducens]